MSQRYAPDRHKLIDVPHRKVGDPEGIMHYKPDTPLNVAFHEVLPLPADLTHRIKRVMSWEDLPALEKGERTALITLNGELDNLGYGPLAAIALKGVGVRGGDDLCVPPLTSTPYFQSHGPGGAPLMRTDPRFSYEGELYADIVPPDPIGGSYSATARHEAELYQAVRELKIPTVVPLGWGEYQNRPSFGQPTGALVYALPKGNYVRSAELYFERDKPLVGATPAMRESLETSGENPENATAQWKLLSHIEVTRGATLRALHDGGLYGFQLHPGNLSIDLADRDKFLLHDMENGLYLEDAPDFAQAFLMANDLATTLHGMILNIARLFMHRPENFGLPKEMSALENPLAAQLAGYFKVNPSQLPKELLAYAEFLFTEVMTLSTQAASDQELNLVLNNHAVINFNNVRTAVTKMLLNMNTTKKSEESKSFEAYKLMGTHYEVLRANLNNMLVRLFMNDKQSRATYFKLLEQIVDPAQHQAVSMELSRMAHVPKSLT
ncbi:hypothetical protein KBD59_01535 [Candidatus Gracilibacteria bacterium]|nr:hypothetical protein [Candidatus Gracilibacteria bacterium]